VTETILDDVVTADLCALAADGGHPAVREVASPGVFREADDRLGRARALVEWTGVQLAVRRQSAVYASRAARIIAGSEAALTGLMIAVLAQFDDGAPFMLLVSLGICVPGLVLAYALTRSVGARLFLRRMGGRAPLPGDLMASASASADTDTSIVVERGRRLAERLDGWSVGATIAAMVTLMGGLVHGLVHWQASAMSHAGWDHGGDMAASTGLAIIAAIVVGRACQRATRSAAPHHRWIRRLAGFPVVALGLAVAIVSAGLVTHLIASPTGHGPEPAAIGFAAALSAELAAFLVGSWIALRLRARERRLLSGEERLA
jgi:hypothetical protein